MDINIISHSVNFIQLNFVLLALCMAVFGLLINYGDRYFPTAVIQVFRYGRANMSKAKPSFVRAIEVPKSWFAHFYLFSVIIQSIIFYSVVNVYLYETEDSISSLVLNKILLCMGGDNRKTTVSVSTTLLVVCMFLVHVTRRFYETVFVSVYSDTKMNVLHYGLAFLHYSGSMLSIIAHSPIFSGVQQEKTTSWTEINIFQLLAVLLFLYGSLEQYKAHRGYADLRKNKDKKVVTYGHKIPTGGLFDLISCPNYFAEIIIYISISFVFGFQNSTWNCVTVWVIVNQIVSGVMNHKWYLEKFPEYPKNRKAIIPYLY